MLTQIQIMCIYKCFYKHTKRQTDRQTVSVSVSVAFCFVCLRRFLSLRMTSELVAKLPYLQCSTRVLPIVRKVSQWFYQCFTLLYQALRFYLTICLLLFSTTFTIGTTKPDLFQGLEGSLFVGRCHPLPEPYQRFPDGSTMVLPYFTKVLPYHMFTPQQPNSVNLYLTTAFNN